MCNNNNHARGKLWESKHRVDKPLWG
jgi:hypothetical protein